jgi:uncharacterized membrane protein (Fun14 family)
LKVVLEVDGGFYKDLAEFDKKADATAFVKGYALGKKHAKARVTVPDISPTDAYAMGQSHTLEMKEHLEPLGLDAIKGYGAGLAMMKGTIKVVE